MNKIFHLPFNIFHLIRKISSNPFFTGSVIMVVGSNIYNFGQSVFHFLTGRFLGKAAYGEIASLISILAFVAIIQISLGLTIVKFIAGQKKAAEIRNFARWVNWWTIWAGVFISLLVLVLSPQIAEFLNIRDKSTVYLLAPTLLFFILTNTGRSILQGTLLFGKYVISLFSEVGVKIALAVFLVLAGWGLFGAFSAILVGIAFSFFVTRAYVSSFVSGKRGKVPDVSSLVSYSFPVFIQGLALTSMYSMDLVLVKHFFAPETAGIYASIAVIGRIVFFGVSPVTHTMFPIVARRFSHGEPYHKIFYAAILLVGGLAGFLSLLYFLLPTLPLSILYGAEYLGGAPYLGWYGIFMTLLALSMLLTQFYLSVGKTRLVWLFAAASILQVLLIWFFHGSILSVIQISILSAALLVGALLLYFPYHHVKCGFGHR